MKLSNYAKAVIMTVPLLLTACHSKKNVVTEAVPQATESVAQTEILTKVAENTQATQFVSSKVKFSIEIGPQQVSLTGNLRIKRDDVIRLQLMAFGFVEAGRIEFTKDYVLIMDRINKMYMRAPYNYIDFLRNSGINFYTLQALFYNELFKPGEKKIDLKNMMGYHTVLNDEDAIITLEQDKMSYSWLANPDNGQIKIANMQASQTAQTAKILADNAAQTQALEQYLNPVPIPAYMVQNPNCCGQNWYSSCGCNGVA